MSNLINILNDLEELKTDNQILSYWENRQSRIINSLRTCDTDFDIATKIMNIIAKRLNNKEKYSSIYFLFQAGYLPTKNKLPLSLDLNELKFELARGLHYNRKYEHAKNLFNELALSNFDTNRFDDWWDQSAFASIRNRIWVKTDLLTALGTFIIMVTYILITLKTEKFLIATIIYIVILELYETWSYKYRVDKYLEYFDNIETEKVKVNIKKKIIIELGFSLIIFPLYLLNQDWLIPLVLIIALYSQVFHYRLNFYYLPKIIGELNRKKARHANMASATIRADEFLR